MSTYSDKLKDPRWQKKRLEIMQRDSFACQECLDDTKTLHVHHTRYVKGREPWEYANGFLVTLCEHCHEQMHEDQTSVVDQLAGSFYEHGATWNVLWGLAAAIDFSLPNNFKLSPEEWSGVFDMVDSRLKEIASKSEQ